MYRITNLMLAGALATLAGCASTKVLDTWRAPEATQTRFKKVLVIAPSRGEPTARRVAETEVVRNLKATLAVASYTLLADEELDDKEKIHEVVVANNFDGILVFRVVDVDEQAVWVPYTYSGGYYGYGYWGGPIYDGGYIDRDTRVRVDTSMYSASGELVWASTSETYNPGSTRKLADRVADAVAEKMKDEGVPVVGAG